VLGRLVAAPAAAAGHAAASGAASTQQQRHSSPTPAHVLLEAAMVHMLRLLGRAAAARLGGVRGAGEGAVDPRQRLGRGAVRKGAVWKEAKVPEVHDQVHLRNGQQQGRQKSAEGAGCCRPTSRSWMACKCGRAASPVLCCYRHRHLT
jgi:hypothetical protein